MNKLNRNLLSHQIYIELLVSISAQPQLELPIGCFKMGPNGMEIIASRNEAIKEQQPKDER